ncbi:ABC-2 type transport system ATP-binding protein [Caldalkalibacillus uzonensis]|uniref:ABC-2 type transport system ATP-binding protein n=1 Tax=Caldalkalibacillus uzonensis TaxID=353224 RepID=A0ABU0CN36_9BACI|nr:ABC transporter ATP-binding protein [Caldalkalibacillus uzonensis]MDQ0337826.1 ABC-2 type transport system ATP-binding protein [Caldalkalibacillus uzonensis]
MGVIELEGLTKIYDDYTAVDHIDLSVEQGEIFGLLGPNGAGKTTTILMMLGLIEPTSGSVRVCQIDSIRYPMEVKQRVGYLPDDLGFYDERTGLENLLLTAQLNGIPLKEARSRAEILLDRVGLAHAAHQKAGTYSRGMRQRLGLADVLMKKPEVIVLDEPTLGLDPEGMQELLALIQSLSRNENMTVLLSSHHLYQVQQICDRVGLFVGGRLMAVGPIDQLAREMFKDEPLVVFLRCSPASDQLREEVLSVPGVISAETEGDQWEVTCERDVSAEIARTVVENGARLQHLFTKDYGLDEIYRRYF